MDMYARACTRVTDGRVSAIYRRRGNTLPTKLYERNNRLCVRRLGFWTVEFRPSEFRSRSFLPHVSVDFPVTNFTVVVRQLHGTAWHVSRATMVDIAFDLKCRRPVCRKTQLTYVRSTPVSLAQTFKYVMSRASNRYRSSLRSESKITVARFKRSEMKSIRNCVWKI